MFQTLFLLPLAIVVILFFCFVFFWWFEKREDRPRGTSYVGKRFLSTTLDGHRATVIVDEQIPCFKKTGLIVYSGSKIKSQELARSCVEAMVAVDEIALKRIVGDNRGFNKNPLNLNLKDCVFLFLRRQEFLPLMQQQEQTSATDGGLVVFSKYDKKDKSFIIFVDAEQMKNIVATGMPLIQELLALSGYYPPSEKTLGQAIELFLKKIH
jgi:hypothetical protein